LKKDAWEEIDWYAVQELVTIDVVGYYLGQWLQDPREARRTASARLVGDLSLEDIAGEICEMARGYLRYIPDEAREPFDVYCYMRRKNFNFIWKRYLTIVGRERARERRETAFRARVKKSVLEAVEEKNRTPTLDREADHAKYLAWRDRLLRTARRRKRLFQLIEFLFPPDGPRDPIPQKDIGLEFNLTEGRISQLFTELVELIMRALPEVGAEIIKFTHRLEKKGEKGRVRAKTD
jgi:hypothetical protein